MGMLVGVTGYRRCGKDSTAKFLVKHFDFQQHAFADALRVMAAAVNPVISLAGAPEQVATKLARSPREWRYNDLLRELGYELAKELPDLRGYLQKLGAEGVRATFGPNAWVEALARSVHLAASRIAISDVRFRSEADWVLENGGIIWRIIRPGHGGDDPHSSEVEIPALPAAREIVATSVVELELAVLSAAKADLGLVPRTGPPDASDMRQHASAEQAAAERNPSAGEGTRAA